VEGNLPDHSWRQVILQPLLGFGLPYAMLRFAAWRDGRDSRWFDDDLI
jgi:hypothetical protein